MTDSTYTLPKIDELEIRLHARMCSKICSISNGEDFHFAEELQELWDDYHEQTNIEGRTIKIVRTLKKRYDNLLKAEKLQKQITNLLKH
mgnify:CR=1 FL=1